MRQTFAQDIAPQLRSAIFSSGLSAKLICLFCLLGYCLSYSSQCVRALTVIPGRLMPPNFWIWTFVTHSFIELHVWHTLIDVIVVFLYAKMIEPLWGSRELVKFYFIVTIPNALVAASTYILCYGLTFNEEYLFERPIYGLASFIGAFTVVIKQIMPETVLANTPFFKLRQDHVPLLIVLLSTILWLASLVPLHFLIMLTFGIAVSWIYLRFFQPHSNGTAGDMSSSFSCSSFFPPVIAPVVSVLANTIFEIFVKLKLCKPMPKKPLMPTTNNLSVTIPGPDAADADRRRQKALKALNDRMKLEKAGVDSWPEMDDPSQTPLLPSTHSNAPTSVTIEMHKDNLNQSSTSSSST